MPSRRTRLSSFACVLLVAISMPLNAFATDFFVRKTGNNASAGTSALTAWLTVDHAADNVSAGDTIYVGAGTYSENITPAATCLGTAVSPIRFLADADGSQTGDAGDVVLTAASGVVLELGRFGVVNSYIEFDGFKFSGSTSHAIYCNNSTEVVFENCEVYNSGSNGMRFDANAVTIRNCSFHDNTSSGIYLYNGATGTIEDTSVYTNNNYAGILVQSSSTATIRRCRIYDNLTIGVSVNGSTATISNSLITGNTSSGASVDYQASNDATFQNCTFADNSIHGLQISNGTNSVTNCIFANNGDYGIYDSASSTRLNNLIYGNANGNTAGNSTEIVADAKFIGATDYRITLLSPARNAGADLTGIVDDDIEGRTRPYDVAYDIGCYEEGPKGHWKLDEGSGVLATDSSSFGNDGTYTNGPTLGVSGAYSGAVLTAVEFDGVDDFVDLPDMNLDFSQGISVAFWVKPEAAQTDFVPFFSLSNGTFADDIWIGWDDNEGAEIFLSDTSDGTAFIALVDNTLLTIGEWQHYVMTIDSGGDAKIYRNGLLSASGFIGLPKSVLRTQNMIADSVWNYAPFNGALDEMRLYNRPLSATEVSELYGLVGHWNMSEGAGTTAADSTGYGNDATLNGATWTTDCAGNHGLEFDGLGDTATTNSSFDPPDVGAISAWLRSAGNPGSRSRPFGVGGDWEMRQEPDGTLSFDLGGEGPDEGAGGDEFITTEGLSFEDRWYHVVAQFDATDDSFEVYINGELTDSGTNGDDMAKQLANTLTFGTRTGNVEYWEGALRDFRVYNRWLGNSEISELSGLAGYWKLDETSGTVAVDSSPNGNDGTYTNGVLINQVGTIDRAADFDGTDDYVGVADDTTLQMDSEFSMSMWVRADDSTNVDRMILNKEGEYEIALSSSGELKWGITNKDPGWSWHSTGYFVSIGKWTHLALTYDYGTVSTYANGVLVDTYSGSGDVGDQYTSLNELRIGGRSNNPPGKYFDGRIDDVRVFSRVMCPEEVFGQYKGGRPAGIRILKWIEVR